MSEIVEKKLNWRDVKCLLCHKHRRYMMTTLALFENRIFVPICYYCLPHRDTEKKCTAILIERHRNEPAFWQPTPTVTAAVADLARGAEVRAMDLLTVTE